MESLEQEKEVRGGGQARGFTRLRLEAAKNPPPRPEQALEAEIKYREMERDLAEIEVNELATSVEKRLKELEIEVSDGGRQLTSLSRAKIRNIS